MNGPRILCVGMATIDLVFRLPAIPREPTMVDEAGERLVCGYTDPTVYDAEATLPLDKLAGFDAVHADCRWWKAARQVLPAARALGIPTVFDGDIAPGEILSEVAPLAQYPIFSEKGLVLATPGIGHDGTGLHKLGVPDVKVIDTLGAGDVFHGAYTYALSLGMGVSTAARFASATAALKCTRFGGRSGTPTHAEVDALLERWDA